MASAEKLPRPAPKYLAPEDPFADPRPVSIEIHLGCHIRLPIGGPATSRSAKQYLCPRDVVSWSIQWEKGPIPN